MSGFLRSIFGKEVLKSWVLNLNLELASIRIPELLQSWLAGGGYSVLWFGRPPKRASGLEATNSLS